MDTRRSFLKKAGLLSGAAGFMNALPETLRKALEIDPALGSTFYDAEHIVFLMQENRSFDHAFGTLQGVRGHNDPRAIRLANQNKVWLQTNKKGETYAPFHLDINNTKITWMGCLPHAWDNQVDARNGGLYDKWIDVKDPGGDFKDMPLTMGYYTRADIPFYYSLADSFTICDQHFCSSLTGTTPNRLYFWSGTIREKMQAAAQANVWNGDADHGSGIVHWKTYPERLEENGISWKVYQNEIYADVGLENKQSWLDNFGDNPLEYFSQYNTYLSPEYIAYIPEKIQKISAEIKETELKIAATQEIKEKSKLEKTLLRLKKKLAIAKQEQIDCTKEKFESLSAFQKNIHKKAFTNNRNDPHYHDLSKMEYNDGGTKREMDIPKGDVLHQFREDVKNGKLPTVSWLAAPQYFSDHPDSPWFGAWYVSEVIDILTQNPEVWKKTIFVLTYDENDGYYDHIPPFGAPNPYKPNTGKVSTGIDPSLEFVRSKEQSNKDAMRESNIGLGFRVPMIIASPWTRGGYVCSEVFDHTSSLQFLENFLAKKTGKKIIETNITPWRRTVCGDLTAAFRTYNGEKITTPEFLDKEKFIQSINNVQFKEVPKNFQKLDDDEIAAINNNTAVSLLQGQENGIRSSCALPYELYADGNLSDDKKKFEINFKAGNSIFGANAAGSPFYVYARNNFEQQPLSHRDYAIAAGDMQKDEWDLNNFENQQYHLELYGPNGFYRAFRGDNKDPLVVVQCNYQRSKATLKKLTGNLLFVIENKNATPITIVLADNSYKQETIAKTVAPFSAISIVVNLSKSYGWYDSSIKIKGNDNFEKQFAGHVETGAVSKTDPLMGRVV